MPNVIILDFYPLQRANSPYFCPLTEDKKISCDTPPIFSVHLQPDIRYTSKPRLSVDGTQDKTIRANHPSIFQFVINKLLLTNHCRYRHRLDTCLVIILYYDLN